MSVTLEDSKRTAIAVKLAEMRATQNLLIANEKTLIESCDLQTTPRLSAQETRNVAGDNAKAGWRYAFGTIFGLVAATIGANAGTRGARTYNHNAQQES